MIKFVKWQTAYPIILLRKRNIRRRIKMALPKVYKKRCRAII